MKLYHYTKMDTAITKILPNMGLKFNKVINMNDPVENLLYLTSFEDNISDYGCGSWISEALNIQNKWQILSFSVDGINKFGYKFQRMWAQYGHNNIGICLEIDLEKFKEVNKNIIEEYHIYDNDVTYSDFIPKFIPSINTGMLIIDGKFPDPVDTFDSNLNTEQIQDRFFTKNEDWRGESEYRFVVKTGDEVFLSLKDSLNCIYLGVGFSRFYLHSLLNLVPIEKLRSLRIDSFGGFHSEYISKKALER